MKASAQSLDRLEHNLGRLLQTGVVVSAGCLAVGLLLWFSHAAPALANGALTLGLVVLMATPILRVIVSLVAYVRMRDWFFVLTTVTVFVLLAITVTLAWTKIKAGG